MAAVTPVPIVSLLTDFGTRDHYAGVMKAVIAEICPDARIIDISHDVEPFQIAQGGYLLSQAWRWFPRGSVHLAVIDPGVGSARRALVAEAEGHRFVLPDNGLLALSGATDPAVRELRNEAWRLSTVSGTFHGRDIFAPAAARLASGAFLEDAGPLVDDWVRLELPASAVLHIDRFGNVVTSLNGRLASDIFHSVEVRGTAVTRFASNYSAAPAGELFVIPGSGGYLEISEREASAAERLGCRVGDAVRLIERGKNRARCRLDAVP